MAGEWIKMRTNLWNDPRVSHLCDLTGCEEATVIGGLYWLWATADDHSADGILPGLTAAAIARKTGVPNLGNALVGIGWIEEIDGGLRIFKFDDHNGASAKSRAQTAKRVGKHRGNGTVTQSPLQEAHVGVTGALARKEKEKNKKDSGISNAVTPNAKIALGDDGAWTGIPDALMATWKQAYPALSLDAELSKAAAWIIANPANKKSNYARFLTNWLTRAQDHAPRVKPGQAAQQPRNARFDAVAFVNRNRTSENHERTDDVIDV